MNELSPEDRYDMEREAAEVAMDRRQAEHLDYLRESRRHFHRMHAEQIVVLTRIAAALERMGGHVMTAADQRFWLDCTPAGDLYSKRHIPVERSLEDIERDIEDVNAEYRARFRRDLTEEERGKLRILAERRTATFAGDVTLEDAHRMGWGFTIEHKAAGRDHGIAVQIRPGVWEGDPAIVARARVNEQVVNERIRDAQAMGWPGRTRGVAGAT